MTRQVDFQILEVYIVSREDDFYELGRNLTENVYEKVWQTQTFLDNNDYGIIVVCDGEIIGNVNMQLKQAGLLNSERFFVPSHWTEYFETENTKIAEISGFAVSQNIPKNLSNPTKMLLITGLQQLCRIKVIKNIITIQHEFLVRILNKRFGLPLTKNTRVTIPDNISLPNCNYWNSTKIPAIYYLNPLSSEFSCICYSFLTYLSLELEIQPLFRFRINFNSQSSYSKFYKNYYE